MRDVFGPGTILGYCTNVHAGATYEQTLANLERYAARVKELASPDEPMGVGLWLSARAARQVLDQDKVGELREWLQSHGLLPYTFNGFPHGDFHQAVVKFKVYQPDWSEEARLVYSIDLANILASLLPEAAEGSISTSPVGWGENFRQAPEKQRAAAVHLRSLADYLARVEAEQGRLIHVNLEPEPGCLLTTSQDVVNFFARPPREGGSPPPPGVSRRLPCRGDVRGSSRGSRLLPARRYRSRQSTALVRHPRALRYARPGPTNRVC